MNDKVMIAKILKEEIELEYRDFVPLYLTLWDNNVYLISCNNVKEKVFILEYKITNNDKKSYTITLEYDLVKNKLISIK